MECKICKCWVEIEEPNPIDVAGFKCDDCMEVARRSEDQRRELDAPYVEAR